MNTYFPVVENISLALRLNAGKHPNKPYLIYSDKVYTYYEIDELVDKTCSFLIKSGISKGEIISLIIRNSIEYILIYMAGLRMGCPINPYPYNLESKDILKYLGNVNPSLMFCQEKHYPDIRSYSRSKVFLVDDSFIIKKLQVESKNREEIRTNYDSSACIYYSSGTTGNPKSIVFSHRNMVTNISSIIRGFRHQKNDVHLIILPMGHTASVNYSFLPCTLFGGTLIIAESFWKIRSKFWEIIKKYNVNYVEVVPSILVALLNTPYPKEQFSGIKSLKYMGCGSATLPLEVQVAFQEKYGIKVANLYGLSETGPTHVDYPLDEDWKPGSIGKPLDVNEVCIIGNGHFLGPNEEGEIVIKGENVFIEYHNNKKLYKRMIVDGYFHTGDLGYFDNEGTFYFTGRKKDLIIKGGINISPDEIDEVIFKLDEVNETATVGMFDEYLGEKIVTFIVLKEGKNLDEKKVKEFCKDFLSRDKIPDIIRFIESIPKGPSGKIIRRELIL